MLRPTKGKRLGKSAAHEKLILNNLVKELIKHKQIHTTLTKAKRLRPYAERIISISKTDNLINRRRIMGILNDKTLQHILFTQIAKNTSERNGGWLRIVKTGPRKGDATKMAVVEIILDKKAEEQEIAAKEALKKQAEELKAKAAEKESSDTEKSSDAKDGKKSVSSKSKKSDEKSVQKPKSTTKKTVRNRTTSK